MKNWKQCQEIVYRDKDGIVKRKMNFSLEEFKKELGLKDTSEVEIFSIGNYPMPRN